jgi:hypothetical protein
MTDNRENGKDTSGFIEIFFCQLSDYELFKEDLRSCEKLELGSESNCVYGTKIGCNRCPEKRPLGWVLMICGLFITVIWRMRSLEVRKGHYSVWAHVWSHDILTTHS